MATATVKPENRRDEQTHSLAVNTCAGSCTYKLTDGEYIYESGSCSGTGSCPHKCPGSFGSDVSALLHDLYSDVQPDASVLNVSCARIAMVASITSQRTSLNTFRKVSIALGTVLAVSLIANAYLLLFR
jgi:hypothetical protein